jgi:hypothetical protein
VTLVAVRDLETGAPANRPSNTPTLDVPADLAPGAIFTVADGFRASYTTAAGKQVSRNVTPGPLAWRAQGETCLIARTGGAQRGIRHYRLCWIAPAETPPLTGSPVEKLP